MAGVHRTAPGGFLREEHFFWWRTSISESHCHPLYSLGSIVVWGIPARPVSRAFCLQLTDNSKDTAFEASVFLNILLLVPEWCILRRNQPLCSWNKGAGGSNLGNADGPPLLPLLWAPQMSTNEFETWGFNHQRAASSQGELCHNWGTDLPQQGLQTCWRVSFPWRDNYI